MDDMSKEQAAEAEWARIAEEQDREQDTRTRRNKAYRRNGIVAFVAGLVSLVVGIWLAGALTNWRGESEPVTGQIVAVLGIILIVLGIYYTGKRVK